MCQLVTSSPQTTTHGLIYHKINSLFNKDIQTSMVKDENGQVSKNLSKSPTFLNQGKYDIRGDDEKWGMSPGGHYRSYYPGTLSTL